MKTPIIEIKNLSDGTFGLKLKGGGWWYWNYRDKHTATAIAAKLVRQWKPTHAKVNFSWECSYTTSALTLPTA